MVFKVKKPPDRPLWNAFGESDDEFFIWNYYPAFYTAHSSPIGDMAGSYSTTQAFCCVETPFSTQPSALRGIAAKVNAGGSDLPSALRTSGARLNDVVDGRQWTSIFIKTNVFVAGRTNCDMVGSFLLVIAFCCVENTLLTNLSALTGIAAKVDAIGRDLTDPLMTSPVNIDGLTPAAIVNYSNYLAYGDATCAVTFLILLHLSTAWINNLTNQSARHWVLQQKEVDGSGVFMAPRYPRAMSTGCC
jgi:hypothetical protein